MLPNFFPRRIIAALTLVCLFLAGRSTRGQIVYVNNNTPMIGMSGEYLPHVATNRSNTCTLATHVQCFAEIAGLNKTQLWLSLNSSPGFDDGLNTPYTHEQPFFWDGAKWNINRPDLQFYTNVDQVIMDAQTPAPGAPSLIVEVTLFDQWNGNYAHSPWNPNNTRFAIGFTNPLFLTSYNCTGTNCKDAAGSQDATARTAQMNFITYAVQQLAGKPNIIWEIANEPDSPPFDPASLGLSQGTYIQNLIHWHEDVAALIAANDPNHHVIGVNLTSKQAIDALAAVIQSNIQNNKPNNITMINGHYVRRTGNVLGTAYGAPEIIGNYGNPPSAVPVAFGFNESKPTPNPLVVGARAEAWEFMASGGASYDNYSFGMEPQPISGGEKAVISYLSNLVSFLQPLNLSAVTRDDNQTGQSPSWASASPPIAYAQNNVYWGAMHWNRQYALYVHHSCIASVTGGNNPRYKPICSNHYQNTFTLGLHSVPQSFNVEWFTPDANQPICTQRIDWQGTSIPVTSPSYTYDLGLRVRKCTIGVDCSLNTSCSTVVGPACPLIEYPDNALCP